MNTSEAIMTRRSIRKYGDDAVTEETIEDLLKAAMAAPSAGNQQPWHFIVIDDKDVLERIQELAPNAAMAEHAALAILVIGDPSNEKFGAYWPQDCAAATENLLLAAHDKGLGAVWCGIFPRKQRVSDFIRFFDIPKQLTPFCIIPIGSPAEEKGPSERYDANRVHKNKWA
ncbi:nitroreductase family protein, partial [Nitrospirota bacterium]